MTDRERIQRLEHAMWGNGMSMVSRLERIEEKLDAALDAHDKRLSALEGWRAKVLGAAAVATFAVSMGLTMLR